MTQDEKRPTVTAAIIARDEQRMIPDCLSSVEWADEIVVVVDAATTDATARICSERGARVEVRVFENFAAQRDIALELARGDWVLFVDADERVPAQLRDEIRFATRPGTTCDGYWVPRDNYILGRVVRTMGWYPDFQLRLLKRGAAHFDPVRIVHEVPVLAGPVGHLSSPFVHLNYASLGAFWRKQERYCALEAVRWRRTHGRPRRRSVVGQPLREFWRRYVVLSGYREGWRGLILSGTLAWYAGKTIVLARRPPP